MRLNYGTFDDLDDNNGNPIDGIVGVTDYAYNTQGKLFDLRHKEDRTSGSVEIANYDTSYDSSNGRSLGLENNFFQNGGINKNTEARSLVNDAQGRVLASNFTSVTDTIPFSAQESYTYDTNGNRLTQTLPHGIGVSGPTPGNNVIGLGNRLLEDDIYQYTYDLEGHLIERNSKVGVTVTSGPSREVYKWNAGGQLIQIDQFNPGDYAKIEYRYDVFGREAATKTTQYTSSNGPSEFMAVVWNGSERVLEIQIDSSANTTFDGKIVQSYLNGPNAGEVLAADVVVNSSGERRTIWMFADTVGTVRSYAYYGTVASNPTMFHRHYDAFGFEYDQTGTTDNDYLKQAPSIFAGSWRSDAAKLYDMNGRWYDPKTGRFLNDAGGENGYAARIDQQSLNSRGATGTPISNSQWDKLAGPNADGKNWFDHYVVDPGAQFGFGIADSIAFGHADAVYGSNSASMNRGTGLYFAGLGLGIAGQLFAGNWAAGVFAAKGATTLAKVGATAYLAYAAVGDVVGIVDSSRAIANGTFTPLDALGFVPVVGWGASAMRATRALAASRAGVSALSHADDVARYTHSNLLPILDNMACFTKGHLILVEVGIEAQAAKFSRTEPIVSESIADTGKAEANRDLWFVIGITTAVLGAVLVADERQQQLKRLQNRLSDQLDLLFATLESVKSV